METVIPPEVLEHLKSVASENEDRRGWFLRRHLQEALGLQAEATRRRIRKLMLAGRLERRRFCFTDQEADEMGMLAGCGAVMYRMIE